VLVSNILGDISLASTLIAEYVKSKYFLDFTYVGMASSYYIYFYNSTEYRIAFLAILRNYLGLGFFSRFIPKQSIAPVVAFIGNKPIVPHFG
jgi:hypothetical protein